jgi:hypothetical protein
MEQGLRRREPSRLWSRMQTHLRRQDRVQTLARCAGAACPIRAIDRLRECRHPGAPQA